MERAREKKVRSTAATAATTYIQHTANTKKRMPRENERNKAIDLKGTGCHCPLALIYDVCGINALTQFQLAVPTGRARAVDVVPVL